ncbi:Retrovirus-related Pol polyprotein from transposon RE1-like protein [Drosera capensis]
MHLLQASSAPVLNPDYFQWQRIDHIVRSWIITTLSRDILVEVLNLKLVREIRDRLHHRFMLVCMARSMELKRKLTFLRKASSDSMEKYLCDIKILADSLVVINSIVSNADLIEHTLMGLGTEYESLIVVVMNTPIAPSFDDIRSKLLLHEQRLKFLSSVDLPQHQTFAAAPLSSGGRGRFQGGGSGGRSSHPQSRRGSFSGQASRPSKGILGDRSTSVPDRSGFCYRSYKWIKRDCMGPSKGCVYPLSIATASPPLVSRTSQSIALTVSVAPFEYKSRILH